MPRRALHLRVLLVLSLLASPLLAQDAAPKPLPILDEQTFLVMRFDMNQLDFNLVGNWLIDTVNKSPIAPEHKAMMVRSMPQVFGQVAQFRDALTQNGVEQIYLAWSTADFPRDDEPSMFATMAPTGDPVAVATLMHNGPGGRNNEPPDPAAANPRQTVSAELAGGVFRGRAARYKRFQDAKPVESEIQKRLADAPATSVYVALIPNDAMKAVVEQELAGVPAPWNGVLAVAIKNAKQVVATAQAPPGVSAHIEIHAADAAGAAALKEQLMNALAEIAKARPDDPDIKGLLGALTPVQKDATLTIDLNEQRFSQAIQAPLALATAKAHQNAMRVQSASNMRQIAIALVMHANENNGVLPENLDQLAPKLKAAVLKNPRGGPAEPDYVYLTPKMALNQIQNPAQHVVVYENPADLPPGEGINVAYADGHVEFTMPARLQQALQAQGAAAPK